MRNLEFTLSRLDRLIIRGSIVTLFAMLLGSQLLLSGQTDCSSYNQCPELQGEQNTKLKANKKPMATVESRLTVLLRYS